LTHCGQTITGITGVCQPYRLKFPRSIDASRIERETDSTLAMIIT
jgi:hypothetical protein